MSITKTGGNTASDLITGFTVGSAFHGTLVVTNITSDTNILAAGDTFQLFSGSGVLGAFDSFVLPALPSGLSWDASQLLTTGYLTVANTAAVPIFNPPAGGYVEAQTVSITCLTPGATIYYTTNGSVPTTSSPSGPSGLTVAVPANTSGFTIQAFAFKNGYTASAVVSAFYQTIAIPTWTNPTGGSWATAGNWSNNVVGNGANVTADFSTLTLSGLGYVTLDAPWTIGNLKFGDVGNNNGWEIDPGTGGPLTLAGTNATITVSNQTATITAVIVGTNSMTTAGPGTLILSGNNTFTGNINVTSGTLVLASSANLNSQVSRTFNINSGATLSIEYGGTVSGTTFGKSFGSGITVTGNGTLQFDPANGPNGNAGLGLVNISGGARLSFGMTGGVININSGKVINGGNSSQYWTTNLASLNIAAGATWDNWNGSAVYVDALTGPGTISDGYTAGTSLNFGVNNGSGTFSGNIVSNNTGTVTLNKLGTGTEIFTGTDSNPGTINVNNGALFLNGSTTTTGLVSVANGAILGGAGTIGGRVNVAAGGFLAPGASPVSFGTLTLSLNATNTLTLNGNTLFFGLSTVVNSDQIVIAGNLVLNGANIVQLSAPSGSIPAGTYTLMTYPSKTGSGTLALQAAYPNATLNVGATSVTLNVTATSYVPGAVWQGAVSGVWDGGALNWTRNGTGSSAYVAGDSVTFDDTAAGNFTVSSGSLVAPGSVTFNNSINNYTVSAAIGGSGPLVKNGSGTLTLSGANTYTNTTTLNSGTLRFAGGSALPGASAINLGPGTLQILNDGAGSGGTISLGNSITLNAALTTDTINVGNNGSGHTGNIVAFGALNNGTPANAFVSTINFTAANGYLMSFGVLGLPGSGGNTTTLNPTTTSLIITNVVNQETSFSGHFDTVTLGGTSAGNVINGVISDSSGYTSVGNGDTRVTMSGVGWTLSGTNTYHGPTSVTTGTLTIGGAGELGGGNYAGTIAISSGAALNYASSSSQTLSSFISGAGSLTNAGSGTLILSGPTNTITGPLLVATGELVGVVGGACSNAAVFVASGATNGVQVPVFGGQWVCSNLTYSAGTTYLDINFGSGYPNTTNAPLLVSGNLTNNGTLNLIVRSSVGIGVGVYPLIKYNGVTNGSLPATAFALPAGMVGSLSNDVARKSLDLVVTTAGTGPFPLEWAVGNGTWDLNTTANWKDFNNVTGAYYTGGNAVTFDDSATGASPITVTLNSTVSPANVTVNSTKNYTISGSGGIAGSTGLTKNGTGTLTLSGVNTYTNTTTVNAGTLQFAGSSALSGASAISLGAATVQILNDGAGSSGTIPLGNSITLNAAATTDTIIVGNNGSGHTGNLIALGALNNGTPANGFASTFNFIGSNSYALSFSSVGLPGSTGNNTTLNPTNISLIITNVVNQETSFLTHFDTLFLGGNSTGNVINGVISDSSGYTSVGNGDTRITMQGVGWTLSGTNTYHGPTTISTNTLTIGGAGQLGAGNYTGTISIATNSALNYASSASQILAGVISGAGSLTNAGGILTLTATNTCTGNTAIGAGSTLTIGGAGMLNNGIYSGLIINNGAFNYASSANQTNSGVISGTGSLTNAGPGTLTLTGVNTYTGNTTVNGGTLVITSPTLATNSTVTVANNALLKLNFAVTNQVAALVLNGAPQAPGVYNSSNTPLITGTGSLMIPSFGPVGFTNPTAITGFSLNGANVVISGTNGQAGAAYYLLASTNLSLRLNQWTVVATNVPGSSGNYTFTATNAVTSGARQQFYILSNTNF
jgi:autotransporter-associated beta strand protein